MKAITRTKYGGPEVLEIKEIEKPTPASNEILVRVHATTVNRTDWGILTGKPYLIRCFVGLFAPRDIVTGTDFAGEIEAVGDQVKSFQIGDRVWGLNDEGLKSHAEYMTIAEHKAIAKIPEHISFEEAAASAEGAHYAFNFINKIDILNGDKIIVNGASGGIGSAAVQLLKYKGAYVTAVVGTKNIALLQSLGADKVIDYEQADFTKDSEKYKFVFDSVGKSTFTKCKPLLQSGGVYLSSELGPGAENLYLPLLTAFASRKVIFPIPANSKRSILYLTQLMNEGKFKGVIDRSYGMNDFREAYNYVNLGQKTGNVILRFM